MALPTAPIVGVHQLDILRTKNLSAKAGAFLIDEGDY